MAEQSIEKKVLDQIKKGKRGSLLFASDFVQLGEQKTISKALERLTNDGAILRISRGIYCYPKVDKTLGLGVLYPTLEDIAEAVPDRMALGLSLVNPAVYPLWCNYRNNSTTENAICTRYMPSIVAQLLMLVHHIEDQDIVHAFLCRLAPFGTKHFGVRDFNISGYVENVRTPYHICYAPGELEAISDVSADILRNVNSADDVKAIDMNRFKEMLREKTAGIAPTPDIAFFGRKLNGSGLEEFECPIQLSMPIRVG